MKTTSAGLAVAFALTGCASTSERNYRKCVREVNSLPMRQQEAYLVENYKNGNLTEQHYSSMMGKWKVIKREADEEEKLLASMTPAERATYHFQKKQLELQREQIAFQQEDARARALLGITQSNAAYLQNNAMMMNNSANAQAASMSIYGLHR